MSKLHNNIFTDIANVDKYLGKQFDTNLIELKYDAGNKTFPICVFQFSVEKMSSNPGHVDFEKLEQVNKVYLQRALQDDADLVTDQAIHILRKHLLSKYEYA